MKQRPNSLSIEEFSALFPTEAACRERLFRIRWPDGFICPKCGGRESWYQEPKKVYQCKDKYCRHQASLTAGTIMEHTRLPIKTWFWAIYLMATDKRGSSATYLSTTLKIRYKSAWLLLQKLRSAMGKRDARYLLNGIVEFDDTYFGGPKTGGKKGKGTGCWWHFPRTAQVNPNTLKCGLCQT